MAWHGVRRVDNCDAIRRDEEGLQTAQSNLRALLLDELNWMCSLVGLPLTRVQSSTANGRAGCASGAGTCRQSSLACKPSALFTLM